MPKVMQGHDGLWSVISDHGHVLFDGLTNSQAWRKMDILSGEAVSASEMKKEIRELEEKPTIGEMQSFYSGLLRIERRKNYKSGWAWHQFCEKFGHRPDGLSNIEDDPSRQVWGWVNRKAIPKKRVFRHG